MKLTTTSALALAAASTVAADTWSAWPTTTTTSTKPKDPASSTTWVDWTQGGSSSTTTASTKPKDPVSSTSVAWNDWSKSSSSGSSSSSSKTSTSTKPKDPASSTSVTWANWSKSSSKSKDPTSNTKGADPCTATITVVKTATETVYASTTEVYKTTVTVPVPDKPATVDIKPVWAEWTASSSSVRTTTPSGCVASSTVTSTATSYSTIPGTTTVTKSTLFVGVGGAGGGAATTSSAVGGGKGGNGGKGGSGPTGSTIGTNGDVFTWVPEPVTGTKTFVPPKYTQKPDGSWGGDNDGKNGSGNWTSPQPGSPASNVTKPIECLKERSCNSASNRQTWCDGKDVKSDYYKDYFSGKDCVYDLTITNGTFNHDGTDVLTFLINGQSPGPAIECNWGDMVKVTVHNKLENNGTAIHWHGVRQQGTNDQDGVPGVTECAIAPGSSRTYTWLASSYGSSWYHSHWGTQYGDGVLGPIIIHGPATANYDYDIGPVMITDTFPGTVAQQASIIAHTGPKGSVNYLLNGKNTNAAGTAGQHSLWTVKAGKKYLFRFVNSATQNMYSVSLDGHKMTVIAADFVPIKPYSTEWLNIGIGQRYDVVIEMNQDVDSYFLRAVTQTLCPSACINSGLGSANGIVAYEGVPTNPYLLPTSTVSGNKTAANFQTCDDEPLASLVPFVPKAAGTRSAFSASASTLPGGSVGTVNTNDDGTVFQWFLNNGGLYINYTDPTLLSLAQGDLAKPNTTAFGNNYITLGTKNQWVYFVIQNQFFAYHPMHLHGHDFSVLGQGSTQFTPDLVSTLNFDNPTRRDTAMLIGAAAPGPGGYTVIGFETDNPGAWLMHCHIVWHVDGGLALQYLERPDEIPAKQYTGKSAFQNECSAYASYESKGSIYHKTSGQTGLKRREALYFDEEAAKYNRNFNEVVRRDEHAAHHFLSSHLKRGLGDSHPRHFGRR